MAQARIRRSRDWPPNTLTRLLQRDNDFLIRNTASRGTASKRISPRCFFRKGVDVLFAKANQRFAIKIRNKRKQTKDLRQKRKSRERNLHERRRSA